MTAEEIKLYKEDMKKEQDGFGRWAWFGLIEKLAQGDVTKFEEVTNQPAILCLNLLSYWQERDKKIEKINKEIERNQKNQNR